MTTFDYDSATPEQRNARCAEFMPASDINPLRQWWLTLDGKYWLRLAFPKPSEEEAKNWLNFANSSRENWEALVKEWPYSLRDQVGIREQTLHVRYTDTAGGAVALLEQLVSESWEVALTRTKNWTTVTTVKTESISVIGDQPMPFLVGLLFLMAHGVPVTSRVVVRH